MAYETPVAEINDLFLPPDRGAAAHLWARLAGPAASHLLEPMASTCEVAVLLARRGYWVTGVGLSPATGQHARDRIAVEEQAVGKRLSLVEGDICTVPLPKSHFDLAFVGNGSWHLLTSPVRRATALRNIRRSLRPGAHLALDLFKPIAAASQTLRSAPDGLSNHRLLLQLLTPEEVTAELVAAGFRGVALFGDYSLAPYRGSSSERLLVVASQ